MEHGILFSAPMVRAILDGDKSQTRRVVSPRNSLVNGDTPCMKADPDILAAWPNLDFGDVFVDPGPSPMGNSGPYMQVAGRDGSRHRVYPRVQHGDRLWVRENWQLIRPMRNSEGIVDDELIWPGPIPKVDPRGKRLVDDWCVGYAADGDEGPWRPSIYLPRWACRIVLEVTAVRPERLQAITGNDAVSEGVPGPICSDEAYGWDPTDAFQTLWESINGKRPGCAWSDNPWVWALTFKRLHSESEAR